MIATIFTYGYQSGTPTDLRQYLTATGALLADIRYSPNSRYPEWTREALEQQYGDAYRWVPALGNTNYRTGGPIQLQDPARGLATLHAVLATRPILLLCGCWDVTTCHRRDAAAYLAERLGTPVEHLPGRFAKWPGAAGRVPASPEPAGTVKVLSLTQPWASLMAIGAKAIETRSWGTPYRGPLAIHAAKSYPLDTRVIRFDEPFYSAFWQAGIRPDDPLPLGVILAVGDLVACELITPANTPLEPEHSFGDYTPGRWAWHLANMHLLAEPIPARGSLGLWTYNFPAAPALAQKENR